jgi:dephospho-CoA kinase
MKVLGLTGGIGMGKSACADLLCARGVSVIDTDEVARELVEPGEPALEEIRQTFGPTVITSDGRLRRGELARRVFADPGAREQLEQILHPRIRRVWQRRVDGLRAGGRALTVVVIPLLFETQAESELDATICVACSAATQRTRLNVRGWSAEQITQRVASQLPIEDKMTRATYVIWSEWTLQIHAAQLDRILGVLGFVLSDARLTPS